MAVCDRLRPSGRHLAGRLDLASPGDDKVGADGKDKPRVRASPNSLAPPNQALIVPSSVAKIKEAGPELPFSVILKSVGLMFPTMPVGVPRVPAGLPGAGGIDNCVRSRGFTPH